jgi:DNA-directed RNA polymerase specialized sigma24 family protein
MDGRALRVGRLESSLESSLGAVYGAAVAASRDEQAAAFVTERVVRRAAHDSSGKAADRKQLVERAIVLAMIMVPAAPFASMPVESRPAVALARLVGYSAREIAAALEIPVEDAKHLLRRGLDALMPALMDEDQPSRALVS